ncbi:DUF4238 domain-containing protein [Fibrisoma montanum]|uniref:DUF4238 domain-containing protein n=1 Tax=Fibrisoma montanum TaxID=2305895 RepID=A0A418ME88_9BACT|nr:DUF4238 domain-containing protein [Fibrisoma montanum]
MNQHFVPKVYLKSLENSRRLLHIVSNQSSSTPPKIKEFSCSQVGYSLDFYTIRDPATLSRLQLNDAEAIERPFNKSVEDKFGRMIRLINNRPSFISYQQAQELVLALLCFYKLWLFSYRQTNKTVLMQNKM